MNTFVHLIKQIMLVEIKVPVVGESINEVTLAKWHKQSGDYVLMDELICELESDKATFELNAEKAGSLNIISHEGDNIKIGVTIATIDTDATKPVQTIKQDTPILVEVKKNIGNIEGITPNKVSKNYPSPAAAKILSEKNILPNSIKGTGKDGRITKSDASSIELKVNNNIDKNRESHREKMSSLRKTVSKRLVAAKNETAMLTTFNEVDMKPIIDLRNRFKNQFKETHGVNLGFMSFFTKAVCVALKHFPAVNASIEGEELVFHDYSDISIAVSAPKGLVVPIIRNAESLTFAEIENEVATLAAKARENKLSLEEMTGGTFTITNGGIFGSMLSTPIINPPQSAILGMHNILERPVVIDSNIVIRPMMYIALSYDHRVIDGKESVGFLVKLKHCLENPHLLLSQGKDLEKLLLDLS